MSPLSLFILSTIFIIAQSFTVINYQRTLLKKAGDLQPESMYLCKIFNASSGTFKAINIQEVQKTLFMSVADGTESSYTQRMHLWLHFRQYEFEK